MDMSCIKELPDGYVEIKRLNLQDDKKTMLIVNALAVVLYIVLFAIAFVLKPFDMDLIVIDLIISLLTCVALIDCVGSVCAVDGFLYDTADLVS